jgi:hypothetical protein
LHSDQRTTEDDVTNEENTANIRATERGTMRQKLFVLGSLLMAMIVGPALPAMAQGESAIHGTVKARADGSALPDAVVELQGGALSMPMTTTTTTEGQFAFPRLVPGDYTVTVTHASFQVERYRLSPSGLCAGCGRRNSVCILARLDASHCRNAG